MLQAEEEILNLEFDLEMCSIYELNKFIVENDDGSKYYCDLKNIISNLDIFNLIFRFVDDIDKIKTEIEKEKGVDEWGYSGLTLLSVIQVWHY